MGERVELDTWNEIAEFLGVSPRTAQYYESRLGLPVHRLGGPRSRVLAYSDELSEWKVRQAGAVREAAVEESAAVEPAAAPAVPSTTEPVPLPPRPRLLRILAGPLALAAVVGIGFATYWITRPVPQPASAVLRGRSLMAQDAAGRDLWGFDFGEPVRLARSEGGFVADLDGDGDVEVVVASVPLDYSRQGKVQCFSRDGKQIRWEFVPGRAVVKDQSGEEFFPPYQVHYVAVVPYAQNRPGRVIVSSRHHMQAPNQVAVLDGKGALVGEYWHAGHLIDGGTADLDGDGRLELMLTGVNNSAHSATLVVFDLDRVDGTGLTGSDPRFALTGFREGTEKAVLFFPRSCLALASDRRMPFNEGSGLDVFDRRIDVYVAESYSEFAAEWVLYELDWNLRPVAVSPSVEYQHAHARSEVAGTIRHRFGSEEQRRLIESVVCAKGCPGWSARTQSTF